MKTSSIIQLLFVGTIAFFFLACSEEEASYKLNTKLVQLNCDRTFVLAVTPALQGLDYTSLNTNIATVSEDGVVKAKLVGTTKIVVKDSLNHFIDTVKVVVNTLFTAFADPCLNFGADLTTLTTKLKGTAYRYEELDSFNVVYHSIDNGAVYTCWAYYLSKENKMYYPYVETDNSNILIDAHLNSRYNLMKTYNNTGHSDSYYINPDSTLIVQYRYTSSTLSTFYYHPANTTKIQHILNEEDGELLHHILNEEDGGALPDRIF